MRTIALLSIVAIAAATETESVYDGIKDRLFEDYDYNDDGDLTEREFLDMVTYLDEDNYLTDTERDHAL